MQLIKTKTMEVYYNHDNRNITNTMGKKISYDKAIKLIENGADTNMAMQRLIRNKGNMETVEKEYKL